MKRLNELNDGEKVKIKVLLQSVQRGVTNKGAPYLSLVLQDCTAAMDAKYWNVSEEALHLYQPGMLVEMSGDVLSHNKQLQIRVNALQILDRSTIDLRDYVKASSLSKAELKEQIAQVVEGIKNDEIRNLISHVVAHYERDLYSYPAASKNHHAFVGGLATHILEMVKLGRFICTMFPFLNEDLLIGGIILHDLGKLEELSGPVITEYTVEGKLLGHISIMQAEVARIAAELHTDKEVETLLRHMILSHHGQKEYGSPVLPMIPEAEVLYFIDNLDARMNTLENLMKTVEPGEFSARVFSLEQRSFYQSKLKKA